MRKLVFIFIAVSLLVSSSASATDPTVVTLATQDICPMGCYDDKGNFDGKFIRVIRHVFTEMGIELKLEVVPWARASIMAESGKVDGFFPASSNEKRDGFAIRSADVVSHNWLWTFRTGWDISPSEPGFKTNRTFAGQRGANALSWLQDNGYNVTFEARDYPKLLTTLVQGRVDVVHASEDSIFDTVQALGLEDNVRSIIHMERPLGVYFTKEFLEDHPGFLERFNKHVRAYPRAR